MSTEPGQSESNEAAMIERGGLSGLASFLPKVRTPISLAGFVVIVAAYIMTSDLDNIGRGHILMGVLGVFLVVFGQFFTVLNIVPDHHKALVALVMFVVFSGTAVSLVGLTATAFVRSNDAAQCGGVSLAPRTDAQLAALSALTTAVNKRVDLSERYKDYLRATDEKEKQDYLAEIRASVEAATRGLDTFPEADFRFHDHIFKHHNAAWCHLLRAQSATKQDVKNAEAVAAIERFDIALGWISKLKHCAAETKLAGLAETIRWTQEEAIYEWATWNKVEAWLILSGLGNGSAESLAIGELTSLRAYCEKNSSSFLDEPILRSYPAWAKLR